MSNSKKNESRLIISYLTLRKLIGILGLTFPFVLLFGGYIAEIEIQSSVSYYYHTAMHDFFVAILCIVASFLLAYKGYEHQDAIAGNIAGICAIGVAMIPTTVENSPTHTQELIGYLHLFFAGGYFFSIAYFCLFLFTKSNGKQCTKQKKFRNVVYKTCGYIILFSLGFIALYVLMPENITKPLAHLNPFFWLESIAIFSFGFAWLVKGEAILKDI